MVKISSRKEISHLDPKNILGSIETFPDQCLQAWEESNQIKFPNSYKQAKNIVVCGMGGSRFTPITIKYLFKDSIKIPYEIIDDYDLPGYINQDTLVIISSYSGNTEEPLHCGKQALQKKALVTGISAGGQVEQLLKQNKLPGYIFNPKYNPSGQPRVGFGYMLFGHLGILKALNILNVTDRAVEQAITSVTTLSKNHLITVPLDQNPSKQLAQQLKDKHPFIVTSGFLKGFGNAFANQLNETAKIISDPRIIPELNHHLMEGLKRPQTLSKSGLFLFINSELYSEKVRRRFDITSEIVKKQKINTINLQLTGTTKLSQTLEAYLISSFTTFYLAMMYDTDPALIPWVDYFKEKLSQ